MTLKGVPQSKRDSRWHRKHEKDLEKAKKRHKRGQIVRGAWSSERVEEEFKEAQKRERQTKAPPLLARIFRKLWLWIISTKPVVLARKVAHWWKEKQYRG